MADNDHERAAPSARPAPSRPGRQYDDEWSAVLDEAPDLDAPTVIDPSMAREIREALDEPDSPPRPPSVSARHGQTHIDIAVALGVGPTPPQAAPADVPAPPDGPVNPRAPLLPTADLPAVLSALNPPSNRPPGATGRKPAPARGTDPAVLQRAAATTESVSRLIPVVLIILIFVASGLVATLLVSVRPPQQEHIELRFMALQGRTIGTRPDAAPSRIAVSTEPAGVLVIHGRDILGPTPLHVDLPVQLSNAVGIELSGPYFERWVGQVSPDEEGAYRVSVRLRRRR